MRKLIYSVAMSLDGFIAGTDGEADWIPMDPEIDFAAIFARFDTLVMGSKTYTDAIELGFQLSSGHKVIVFSKSLKQEACPGVEVDPTDAARRIRDLKQLPGKDIWLFGGGNLFKSMLEARLVDEVHLAVVPVLLGNGIPLVVSGLGKVGLNLIGQRTYQHSGIVSLKYSLA